MKQKHSTTLWAAVAVLLLMTFGLTACERPVPRDETADTVPPAETSAPVPTTELIPATSEGEQPGEEVPATEVPADGQEPTPVTIPTEEVATETIHIVQPGETLFLIALQYDASVEEIAAANNLADINTLEVGQQLVIPAPGTVVVATPETTEPTAPDEVATPLPEVQPTAAAGGTHVVQRGENLFRIALSYGCTTEQMAAANSITNPARIYPGQVLTIPDCDP